MSYVVVKEKVLRQYIQEVLVKAGIEVEDAKIIADTLVEADLRGIDSHGVVRLAAYYLKRIKKGLILKHPEYKAIKKSQSTTIIDANRGPGQVVTLKAIRLAMEIAKETGIGLVGVKNSSHFGIAAYFAMEALKEDMIGIALTQADARVAPFGARKAYVGTNPLSVAIPAGEKFPIVLDMATSAISMGKIILGKKKGEKIPQGVAIDKQGQVTTDPNKVVALLSSGGPKGSGLAIIIDILCGILMESSFGAHINFGNDFTKPELLAHLVGAINISFFTSVDGFKRRVDQMIAEIKDLLPCHGTSEVFLPGEKEFRTKKERIKRGIPIAKEIFSELQGLEDCYIKHFEEKNNFKGIVFKE